MVSPFPSMHRAARFSLDTDRAPYTSFVLGIQLCMYSYCARYLWSQRETRRNALFTLAYITAIFIIETMFVGVQARTIQICYVDNRVSPSGSSSKLHFPRSGRIPAFAILSSSAHGQMFRTTLEGHGNTSWQPKTCRKMLCFTPCCSSLPSFAIVSW